MTHSHLMFGFHAISQNKSQSVMGGLFYILREAGVVKQHINYCFEAVIISMDIKIAQNNYVIWALH